LPVEGIGLDAIQAPKPEPRIMRYELTDFEWAAIRSFLPNKPHGIPRVDDRRVLNGIFWVLRSGAPWRELPASCGPRTNCYDRFVRRRQAGVSCGASSTPRLLGSSVDASGILDRPPSRAMTTVGCLKTESEATPTRKTPLTRQHGGN
jgi:hypothetical protein